MLLLKCDHSVYHLILSLGSFNIFSWDLGLTVTSQVLMSSDGTLTLHVMAEIQSAIALLWASSPFYTLARTFG